MTQQKSTLAMTAQRLKEAVEQETCVARAGALDALASAALAKRDAFTAFSDARIQIPRGETLEVSDREAIEDLLVAANENAIVLEAVKSTLDDAAARLHDILGAASDPGTYSLIRQPARHIQATRIDAKA